MSSNSLEFMGNYVVERLHTLVEKYIHFVFTLFVNFMPLRVLKETARTLIETDWHEYTNEANWIAATYFYSFFNNLQLLLVKHNVNLLGNVCPHHPHCWQELREGRQGRWQCLSSPVHLLRSWPTLPMASPWALFPVLGLLSPKLLQPHPLSSHDAQKSTCSLTKAMTLRSPTWGLKLTILCKVETSNSDTYFLSQSGQQLRPSKWELMILLQGTNIRISSVEKDRENQHPTVSTLCVCVGGVM